MLINASLARPARATALLLIGVVGLLAALAPAAVAADPPRYKAYYDRFDRGRSLIPGADTRWVPQGLTYWPERDALVISYYDGDKDFNSRLAIIDRYSGRFLKYVKLESKNHAGGLAMSGSYLWVAGQVDGKYAVTRYAKRTLELTSNGGRAANSGVIHTKASSYATINANKLWVGDFYRDVAYRYTIGENDTLSANPDKRILTPGEVQGMAIHKGKIIWSRSLHEDPDSMIEVGTLRNPTPHVGGLVAPNMSEGIVVAKGELHVLYESGSSHYSGADYRVKTVHHAPIGRIVG